MQKNKGKNQKPTELVHKPIVAGTWNGRHARKLAFKRMLAMLGISVIYLLAGTMLNFDSAALRMAFALAVVLGVAYYQYVTGAAQGASDAAYGEILYSRREAGHETEDLSRSFHRCKGLYAALLGSAPFVILAIVFACVTEKVTYQLGVLPSWTESLMQQTEFSAPLAYYNVRSGISAVSVLRILDRAMIMPFVSVASLYGADAVLLAERLSPLLILIAPMGYAIGYAAGQLQRDRINTGIRMGDERKRRKERKARRQRQRSSSPERLI